MIGTSGCALALVLLAGAGPAVAQDAPATDSTPVATDDVLLHKYVWSTLGLEGALGATVSSGLDQVRSSPTVWGKGATGYAKRWAENYAESAIGDTTKYAVAHFLHQDPSFTRCGCTGTAQRLGHAVDSPFMARTRTGARVLSPASLAGILMRTVVPASTWYPAPLGTRDGLRHATTSLISKIAVDVIREFWPRRSR